MRVRLKDRPHVVGTAREIVLGVLSAPGFGAPTEVIMRRDDAEEGDEAETVPIVDVEVYVSRRRAWRTLPQALSDDEVAVAMDVERNRAELYEPTGDEG